MEKVTQILERHVQWFVLGLTVLFLAVAVYVYWLQPPTVQIGSQELPPGAINQEIVQGPVKQIKEDLKKPAPEIEVNDHVEAFVADMGFRSPQYAGLFEPLDATRFLTTRAEEVKVGPAVAVGDIKIDRLPQPPRPTQIEVSNGRAVVSMPDPKAKPAPVGRQVVAEEKIVEADVDWVTVGATIDAEALREAWTSVFKEDMPENLLQTRLLRVELIRQEKLPNGSWGNQVIVPALRLYKEQPPFPGDNATDREKLEYLEWIDQNPDAIVRPAFYDTVPGKGEWFPPGEEATPGIQRTTIPRMAPPPGYRPPTGRQPGATDQQRRMQELLQRGMRNSRTYNYYAPPNQRPRGPAGARDPYQEYIRRMQRSGGRGGVRPPGSGPAPYPVAPPPFAGAGGGGDFISMSDLQEDIQIWAHDETAVPGKTYRYKLRYYLLNPVHGIANLANNEALSKKLAIQSPDSAWTLPVKVTDRVNFWLVQLNRNQAKFDVFEWKNGEWERRARSGEPGDAIPGTPWTIVDLRRGPKGMYAYIMNNETGQTEQRYVRRDQSDPLYQRLQDELSAGEDAAARGF